MSVEYYLKCEATNQSVWVATLTGRYPCSSSVHEYVIQLFSIAHTKAGFTDVKITTNPENDDDSIWVIDWDESNAVELYERMTQKPVCATVKKILLQASSKRQGLNGYDGWLQAYTWKNGIEIYRLGEPLVNSQQVSE